MVTGSEKLDLKKLYQSKRMRQRAAIDLFSSFTSLNSRGYFGEPLEHVRTPHVSRQSNVAMKDGPDIVMRSSSARSCFQRFLRRKPHEQQRSLKGPVFHRIGHLKKSQQSKRRDLSILVWTWRSKKRKRTAPMRSWKSTEMGNDRWLHHISQIEPLFFFFLANAFGHEDGCEVSAWRDCLESEGGPLCRTLRLWDPLSRTKRGTNKFRIVHSFEKRSKLPPARRMSLGGRTRPGESVAGPACLAAGAGK